MNVGSPLVTRNESEKPVSDSTTTSSGQDTPLYDDEFDDLNNDATHIMTAVECIKDPHKTPFFFKCKSLQLVRLQECTLISRHRDVTIYRKQSLPAIWAVFLAWQSLCLVAVSEFISRPFGTMVRT